MVILLQELAEAAKEQSAKRALRRNAVAAQTPGGKKSINGFLSSFEPTKSSTPGKEKRQEHVMER